MSLTDAWLKRSGVVAICLALVVCISYWLSSPSYPFSTDEAKYALNIAYPHPPLGRWVMRVFQMVLGSTPRVAMMSTALVTGATVGVLFLFARRSLSLGKALLIASAFALLPITIRYGQSAYLSPWLALSFVVSMLGLSYLFEAKTEKNGAMILTVGLVLGLWSQLEAVLVVGVVGLVMAHHFIVAKWRPMRTLTWICAGFVVLHVLMLCMYVAGNPLIIGDIIGYSKLGVNAAKATPFFLRAHPSVYAFEAVVLVVSVMTAAAYRKISPYRVLAWSACGFCILVVALLANNPATYYLPYLAAPAFVCIVLLAKAFPTRREASILPLVALCVFGSWAGIGVLSERGPASLMTAQEQSEISSVLGKARDVIILGAYGYDVDYGFPAAVHRLPTDGARRSRFCITMLKGSPTLSDEEEAWLEQLQPVKAVGEFSFYRQAACKP